MGIVSDMIALQKAGDKVEVPFPEQGPELTLVFDRLAIGEESFLNLSVAQDARLKGLEDPDYTNIFGTVLIEKYLELLKRKLKGWKEEVLVFNEANKNAFFDCLDTTKASELVNLYLRENKAGREASEGNGTKLVKDSGKPSKKG